MIDSLLQIRKERVLPDKDEYMAHHKIRGREHKIE